MEKWIKPGPVRAMNLDMVLKNSEFLCGEQGYTGIVQITNV